MSADYILTGRATEPEYQRIAAKLSRLSEGELTQVEQIIDACVALAGK